MTKLRSVAALAAVLIAGCPAKEKGGGDSTPTPTPTPTPVFSVGGTVTGLSGGTLTLQNNGGDDLVLSGDGPFAFATGLPDTATYTVAVFAKPAPQRCVVSNASGAIANSAVSDVAVVCSNMSRVVFSRAGDLYVVYDDGTGETPLDTSADDATFLGVTSTGRVIFQRFVNAQTDIWAIAADGTGAVPLATDPLSEVFNAVTPTDQIIFGRNGDLFSVSPDGATTTTLAATGGSEAFAALAPSGRIVYSIGPNFSIVDPDGTDGVPLASGSLLGFAAGRVAFYTGSGIVSVTEAGMSSVGPTSCPLSLASMSSGVPFFSAGITTSGRVAWTEPGSSTGALDAACVSNIQTGTSLALAGGVASFGEVRRLTPGGRVIFRDRNDGQTVTTTASANADGSDARVFVAATNSPPDSFFVVSGAVERIVYAGCGGLCIADSDGTDVATFPAGAPVAQVDSRLIVVAGDQLESVLLDGTDPRAFGSAGAPEVFRFVTPSGRVIFSRNGADHDVFSANGDGTDVTSVAGTVGVDEEFAGAF